jgi:hydrogenase maturation protein HypF
LHEVLFKIGRFEALVMTSANISEEPICYQNDESISRLSNIFDLHVMHNRDIFTRCDDSVLRIYQGQPLPVRRSRGYAPRPIIIKKSGPHLMAVGAQLKNTIALAKNNRIYLSQHIGDLENLETLTFFEHSIDYLKNLFEITPGFVIYDNHPDYLSTKWVKDAITVPKIGLQHHYAHILSVMAEKNLTQPLIGIALDGTGYGDDRMIWGGEVLIGDIRSYRRFAHLEYIAMPGGEQAIREPWRMAVAYLKQYLPGWETIAAELFPEHRSKITLIGQQIEKQINSPLTSSCGRLFDVAAALLGICTEVAYEGQAAIKLESLAVEHGGESDMQPDSFFVNKHEDKITISAGELIKQIISMRTKAVPAAQISRMFHNTMAAMLVQIIGMAAAETGIRRVALSGGCFQNLLLLSMLHHRLQHLGYTVYFNQVVPANDGGISLGQAYWGVYNYKNII